MNVQEQLALERARGAKETTAVVDSSVKTVLLHVQNDPLLDLRLQNALALARICSAHLSCLHVTPIEAYVAFDTFGGVFVMNDVIKALDEEEAALRSRIEGQLNNEDVSWDYEQVTGNVAGQIVSHAALSDLVVTGRAAHRSDFANAGIGLLGDLLHRTRTPLFIAGEQEEPCDPTGPALIAWDGSYEAANAVRSAVGLLKLAVEVRVLQVREDKDEAFPGTRLLEFLSRHGIHADFQVEETPRKAEQEYVSGMLMAQARSLRAAYIVMGGYNHSRVGEYLFGGVTRTMIAGSPVPLVIAH